MSTKSRKLTIRMPTVAQDRVIRKAAVSDPDAQPLSEAQLKAMVPLRGRPKLANPKTLVSVRYSAEVLAFFKSTGVGWQSRMDEVLRRYVSRQIRQG
jgi:uncharacterized protein (DUF4415 family)